MDSMFLPDVENNPQATGAYAEMIAKAAGMGQSVPQIWHLFAFKPEATQHLERWTQAVMRGPSPLSPGMRELIASVTSAANQTPFCLSSHAPLAAHLLGDEGLVKAVLHDIQTAPITDAEKALLSFVQKLTRSSASVQPDDLGALRSVGWNDEAIYDAITVCGLFNFFNRWVFATGVREMSEEAHLAAVPRMAVGYLRTAVAQS